MKRAVGVVLLCSLAATACGTQVGDGRRQQAARALLNVGQQGTTATTTAAQDPGSTTVDPTAPTTGPTAGTSSTTTTGGGSAGTPTTGASTTTGGGTTGTAASAGGNGGATDVGVTATSVTVGNVSDLSGPQPGLFQTAVNGTNAYFAYVNSQGGVYGRQLKIAVADAQTSCDGDRNGHLGLINKVFAFAGSFSLFDACGATVLKSNPGIPDSHLAVTPDANKLPNNFSVNPVGNKLATGSYDWATKKFGGPVVQNVGMMWANLPAVNNVAALAQKTAKASGWTFTYTRSVGATETDFTADIVQMRQKGVKLFYSLFNADEMANFKAQADQQGFKPVIIAGLVYDQSFFTKIGGAKAAEGIYGNQAQTLFFSAADAKAIPAVALFQKYYAQVTGGKAADSFAADGWAQAELLVDALKKAGPVLTRAKVLAALRQVKTFDADGFIAPAGPATKSPPLCYVLWQIKNGQYVRVDTPAKSYRCDGHLA